MYIFNHITYLLDRVTCFNNKLFQRYTQIRQWLLQFYIYICIKEKIMAPFKIQMENSRSTEKWCLLLLHYSGLYCEYERKKTSFFMLLRVPNHHSIQTLHKKDFFT